MARGKPGSSRTARKRTKATRHGGLPALLDRVSDGIVVLDRSWRYTYINTFGAALFGRRPEDLLGKHIWTEFPEGVGQPFHRAYERAMATQQSVILEDYYAPWDRWFENRIHPAADSLTILFHEVTDRKRAEAAQRRAEASHRATDARLRRLFEQAADGLFVISTDNRYVDMNRAGAAMLGYAREELLGRSVADVIASYERPRLPEESALMLAGVPHLAEWDYVRKDGTVFPAEVSARRIDGDTYLAILRDRTERRREVQALRDSEAQLRRFVEAAPFAVAMLDREMRYLLTSARWLSDYQLEDRSLAGRSHYEVFPEIPDRWKAVHQRALAGETVSAEAEAFERADGRTQWLRWDVRPWRDAGGAIGGILITTEDVSDHKHAEAALRESTEFVQQVISSAQLGMVVHDAELRYVLWNPFMERLTGKRAADVLGRTLGEVLPQLDVASANAVLQRALSGILIELPPFQLPRPSGDAAWASAVVGPLRDAAGRITGVLSVVLDRGEARQAEHRLQEAYARLRRLAAGREQALESERARIAREIHDEVGQALAGLKMDLKWLGDRVAGRADLEPRLAAMSGLLDATVQVGRRIASDLRPGVLDDLGLPAAVRWQAREFGRRSGLTVHVEVDDAVVVDEGRATAAFRILQEALTNVARHAGAGKVWVRLDRRPRDIRLEVRDDGRGITADQASGSATLGQLGMRERAEAWGGGLDVHAGAEGGTVLRATIPLDDQPAGIERAP